jgi:hypothetical protein
VSRLAIQFVRDAREAKVKDEEIADFVLARAKKTGVSGWDLQALHSLAVPAIGIYIGRGTDGSIYVNGQNRAQAMFDAGVRRTLTVRYWEDPPLRHDQ